MTGRAGNTLEATTVTVDDQEVRCRRVRMVSGRVLLDAYALWPEEQALPRDCDVALRDEDGTWWQGLDEALAATALTEAFGRAPGQYSRRHNAFAEAR